MLKSWPYGQCFLGWVAAGTGELGAVWTDGEADGRWAGEWGRREEGLMASVHPPDIHQAVGQPDWTLMKLLYLRERL